VNQDYLRERIGLLGDKDAAANIAVRDLEVAKKFYGETLGLTQVGSEGDELVVFRSDLNN
jgi:catechol-2,3-dioxygenase